jgi:hypothetical protein
VVAGWSMRSNLMKNWSFVFDFLKVRLITLHLVDFKRNLICILCLHLLNLNNQLTYLELGVFCIIYKISASFATSTLPNPWTWVTHIIMFLLILSKYRFLEFFEFMFGHSWAKCFPHCWCCLEPVILSHRAKQTIQNFPW